MANNGMNGSVQFEAKMAGFEAKLQKAIANSLYVECELIKTVSMKRTPVDTGVLRASHEVQKPKIEGEDISCSIAVGGPAAPYAIYVHENLMAHHPVGQAKFLESAINDAKPGLSERVMGRVNVEGMFK